MVLLVNELIQKIGLQRAAQLISQRWRLVSPVAYEVGISKIFYFIKVFKEEYGVLLSEFV
jgi:AraC-like DNA-binding protein